MPTTTENNKNYFNVEVFGDYFIAGAEGSVIRSFGYVTLRMRIWDNCQKLARFHIIPKLLREADPEFQNMRKCIVTKVSTSDNQPVHNLPLVFMSREDIEMEVKSNNIPLRVDMCPDIVELRNKLRFARSNPAEFAKQEQKRSKSFSKIGDAMDLNKNVFDKIRDKNKSLLDGKIKLNPAQQLIADNLAREEEADANDTFSPSESIAAQTAEERKHAEKMEQRTADKFPEVQVQNPNEDRDEDEVDEFSLT